MLQACFCCIAAGGMGHELVARHSAALWPGVQISVAHHIAISLDTSGTWEKVIADIVQTQG